MGRERIFKVTRMARPRLSVRNTSVNFTRRRWKRLTWLEEKS
jgi:hypothetical protein